MTDAERDKLFEEFDAIQLELFELQQDLIILLKEIIDIESGDKYHDIITPKILAINYKIICSNELSDRIFGKKED